MRNFYTWLIENNHSVVTINDSTIKAQFQAEAQKLIDHIQKRDDEIKAFNPQPFFQNLQQQLQAADYPYIQQLMQALQSQDRDKIWQQQSALRNWSMSLKSTFNVYQLNRAIWTYVDYLDKDTDMNSSAQDVANMVQTAVEGTRQNMMVLKREVEAAIGRITQWNGSPVTISPDAHYDERNHIAVEAATSAQIYVGVGEEAPPFTVWRDENNKIEIPETVDGGDTDFFPDQKLQADYFNLIEELKNPGVSSKQGWLKLYTARPVKDRQMIQDNKTLPVNVFLANDYDHVDGISIDFGGRDIWKVIIDKRYLTKTMDDGSVKYYQITRENPVIKSLELISPHFEK